MVIFLMMILMIVLNMTLTTNDCSNDDRDDSSQDDNDDSSIDDDHDDPVDVDQALCEQGCASSYTLVQTFLQFEDHNMLKIIKIVVSLVIKSINIIITLHTCQDIPSIWKSQQVQNYHDSGILGHKEYHHYHHPTHLSRHSFNLEITTGSELSR